MIKGIIFDFDNTLYDYDIANKYALDCAFDFISTSYDINKELILNTYKIINNQIKNENNPNNKFNKTIYFKIIFEKLKLSLTHLNDCIFIYNNKFIEKYNLFNGVIDLFQYLKSKNIKIGILSNNNFFQQYSKLITNDILKYIDIILTSDECGDEKPSKSMFLLIQHKLNLSFDQLAYVGDNFEHDIVPAIEYGMLPFWYNKSYVFNIDKKIIYFGCFNELICFFKRYFETIKDLIFLSKYFGQSVLNVQGAGGNISVKLDNLLFIKSSGFILGNMSYNEGYCIVNNNECNQMRKESNTNLIDSKIFGYKIPSMETYFHSFMKKITIHLHFTLSNIFFCSTKEINLSDFKYNFIIIDYYIPGIELANQIFKYYNDKCDIYFLKNHGIIITGDDINSIIAIYEYIFTYFDKINGNIYNEDYISFLLSKIYHDNKLSCVIRPTNIPCQMIKKILFCFPDMIVFIKNIIEVIQIDQLRDKFINYDIIVYNNTVYCIAENIQKLYSLLEILESYKILFSINNEDLISINNLSQIRDMPQEKYRIAL